MLFRIIHCGCILKYFTRQHRSDIDVNFIFTNLSLCQEEFIFKIIYRDNYFNLCSSDNKYYINIKGDDKELDNEY